MDPQENLQAQTRTHEIYGSGAKPYKFLFLNGRMRPHRKYLLTAFGSSGLLEQSLYSCLDSRNPVSTDLTYEVNGQDLLQQAHAIKLLPTQYEIALAQQQLDIPTTNDYVRRHLFGNIWGDGIIAAQPYIDTYFSLVTETLFASTHSFRTEKIWKPVAMAHPFIVAANAGYYRDLHNLGFKTFAHLIDESFDLIENHQERIQRIVQVVTDLCRQDLGAFLQSAQSTCKYNQQHLLFMRDKIRQDFPARFFQFINQHE